VCKNIVSGYRSTPVPTISSKKRPLSEISQADMETVRPSIPPNGLIVPLSFVTPERPKRTAETSLSAFYSAVSSSSSSFSSSSSSTYQRRRSSLFSIASSLSSTSAVSQGSLSSTRSTPSSTPITSDSQHDTISPCMPGASFDFSPSRWAHHSLFAPSPLPRVMATSDSGDTSPMLRHTRSPAEWTEATSHNHVVPSPIWFGNWGTSPSKTSEGHPPWDRACADASSVIRIKSDAQSIAGSKTPSSVLPQPELHCYETLDDMMMLPKIVTPAQSIRRCSCICECDASDLTLQDAQGVACVCICQCGAFTKAWDQLVFHSIPISCTSPSSLLNSKQ
jgi:hypothetical protein